MVPGRQHKFYAPSPPLVAHKLLVIRYVLIICRCRVFAPFTKLFHACPSSKISLRLLGYG